MMRCYYADKQFRLLKTKVHQRPRVRLIALQSKWSPAREDGHQNTIAIPKMSKCEQRLRPAPSSEPRGPGMARMETTTREQTTILQRSWDEQHEPTGDHKQECLCVQRKRVRLRYGEAHACFRLLDHLILQLCPVVLQRKESR